MAADGVVLHASTDVDAYTGHVTAYLDREAVDIAATITASIDAARVWLWIDGEPRSTASQQPAVGGIVRIGGVYTPPSIRGRGYARRLVHDISTAALRTPGVRGCTLNTDASNSVSNNIYRQMGYVPVAEHAQFSLQC